MTAPIHNLLYVDNPALRRLVALVDLDEAAVAALQKAIDTSTIHRCHTELLIEGHEIVEPRLLVDGWAARVRILADGRRQLLSFLLPGDLIGHSMHRNAAAASHVVALTSIQTCVLPDANGSPCLEQLYGLSQAHEEAHLLAQIARLGRLGAAERVCDLLLELYERLLSTGQARNGVFNLPMTQETLSDALGLTSVHVNRVLQQIRRSGDLEWRARRVTLKNPRMLALKIGRV